MGKWATRLAETTAPPLHPGTDKTAKRWLLSVLAVQQEEEPGNFHAQPALVAPASLKVPDGQVLAAVAWTDGDIDHFLVRRDRLLRWGWTESEAEMVAERLVRRDRDADPRVSCIDCRHHHPGHCSNHRAAGLNTHQIGRDLAELLQRCSGFKPWSALGV